MDIDLSKYFDTPDREHSYAMLMSRPHLETGLYAGLFLVGGFPLLLLFSLAYPLGWYLKKSIENGHPCCLFPNRRPFPQTKNIPPPEPGAWDSGEERETAEFLIDTFIPPALRPYVQPDTPLCLLSLPEVFAFFSFLNRGWRTVAKHYNFGLSAMNRIHRLLNASPYEKHTFRELVSLILTLDRAEWKNNIIGCLLCLIPFPVYLMETFLVFYTGGGLLMPYVSSSLGLVLFPLQYVWAWLFFTLFPG